jgi:WD40 repeat protein
VSRRTAFLIANQDFRTDSGLTSLRGPLNDVANLTNVLGSPDQGGFTVRSFVNSTSFDLKAAIDEELGKSGKGDIVFVYYTGHGKLDRFGNLCLATADTRAVALQATSIPCSHLREFVKNSDCEAVVLVLDCCYSGAAAGDTRSDLESQLISLGEASGFYILSASSEIQTASESDVDGVVFGNFTAAFLGGIRTGEADYDDDGSISLQDLFKYVKARLVGQSPKLFAARAGGDPIISSVPRSLRSRRASTYPQYLDEKTTLDSVPNKHRTFRLAVLHRIDHGARVVDVAFSRDDSMMATVCDDGRVRTFAVPGFRQIGILQSRPQSLRSASWSKGGKVIATSDTRGLITLWRDGATIGEMVSGSRSLCCAQYSPDGLTLASGSEDGVISLWRPQEKKLIWKERIHKKLVRTVRFSNDGKWIVTASEDGQAVVLDTKTGLEINRFTRHSDKLTSAFFISDLGGTSSSCVSAGLDGEVCVWPIHEGDSGFVATKHDFWVCALSYCDHARLIISGGYDASIRIVDLTTGDTFEAAEVEQGPVICVRASYSEELLVVTTYDGMVYILELKYTDA